LAEGLEEEDLARLYRSLLRSEARHHQLFVDLALAYADAETVNFRLRQLMDHEAEVLARPVDAVRLHT
jgi:tRNA-(ms[2]io[6]A)-hydroxylase